MTGDTAPRCAVDDDLDASARRALHVVGTLQTTTVLQDEFEYLQTDSWAFNAFAMAGEQALARYFLYQTQVERNTRYDDHGLQTELQDHHKQRKRAPLLDVATRAGLLEVVDFVLVFLITDPLVREQCATYALELALLHGSLDIADRLVAFGADAKYDLLLEEIVRSENRAAIEHLLYLGADINVIRWRYSLFVFNGGVSFATIRLMLSLGMDVNHNSGSGTLLQVVLQHDQSTTSILAENAKKVMRYGADLNVYSEDDWNEGVTPLQRAITRRMPELVDMMLAGGVQIDGVHPGTEFERHPLALAARRGDVALVRRLLQMGAVFQAHEAALKAIAEHANPHDDFTPCRDIATMLLEAYADRRLQKSESMWYFLESSLRPNHQVMMNFALAEIAKGNDPANPESMFQTDQRYADEENTPHQTDPQQPYVLEKVFYTPFREREAYMLMQGVAEALIWTRYTLAGTMVERIKTLGLPLLHSMKWILEMAIDKGRAQAANLVLDLIQFRARVGHHPDQDWKETNQSTLDHGLWIATLCGRLEFVELLLQHGAYVNGHGAELEHDTPLHAAAQRAHMKIAMLLLDRGAEINAQSKLLKGRRNEWTKASSEYGSVGTETALVAACREGHIPMVRLLLSRGADVNLELDQQQHTALRAAVAGDHLDLVKYLVEEADADVNSISATEVDALSSALCLKRKEIFEYLFASPKLCLARSPALHFIGYQLDESTPRNLERLLERGMDVNARLRLRGTPLLAAAGMRCKCSVIMRILIERGADINAQSGLYNNTALQVAAQRGAFGKVTLLLGQPHIDVNLAGGQFGSALNAVERHWNDARDMVSRKKRHLKTANVLRSKGAVMVARSDMTDEAYHALSIAIAAPYVALYL